MGKKIALAFLIVLALIVFTRLVTTPERKGPEKDSDVIWQMFSAAKRGNVQQYLDCFTGQSLSILQSAMKEKNTRTFRDYIMQNAQDIKGISILEGKGGNSQENAFDAEIVYANRNEYQTIFLQMTSEGWKVSRISKPAIVSQPIPYLELVVKE